MASFLTAHSITTYPFSALNTDNIGRPKTCEIGGYTRGRLSGQNGKHDMRKNLNDSNETLHTRKAGQYITDELVKRGLAAKDAEKLAKEAIKILWPKDSKNGNKKDDKKDDETKKDEGVMGSFSKKQLTAICDILERNEAPKDEIIEAAKKFKSIDQICFGRMFAGNNALRIDGAVNVAHAFTTHKALIETDYFTATDDLDNVGTGHIGERDGMSGTFYRYASINLTSLFDGLNEEGYNIEETVRNILSTFAYIRPSGGCHNHDNDSLPAYIEFDVRTDRPFSYSAAFDSPVQEEDSSGYEKPSIERLEEYAAKADKSFGTPVKRFVFKFGETNLEDLLDEVAKYVASFKGEC